MASYSENCGCDQVLDNKIELKTTTKRNAVTQTRSFPLFAWVSSRSRLHIHLEIVLLLYSTGLSNVIQFLAYKLKGKTLNIVLVIAPTMFTIVKVLC